MSNIILIAAVEAEEAVRAAGDVPIEDRARAAMRAVRHHWLATQEQDQFGAACEGLARLASPDERRRIDSDLRRLRSLSALLSGVPVDLDAALAQASDEESLGLMKIWHETKEAS